MFGPDSYPPGVNGIGRRLLVGRDGDMIAVQFAVVSMVGTVRNSLSSVLWHKGQAHGKQPSRKGLGGHWLTTTPIEPATTTTPANPKKMVIKRTC